MAKEENKLIIDIPEPIEFMRSTSSVELKRNSKGIVEIVVKIYDPMGEDAAKEAEEVFDRLCKKYKE